MKAARRVAAFAAAVVLSGCITSRASVHSPDARREWPAVLARVDAAAQGRRFDEADRFEPHEQPGEWPQER